MNLIGSGEISLGESGATGGQCGLTPFDGQDRRFL